MKILEDLWYGNIDPQGRPIKKGSEIERTLSLVVKHDDALCKMLADEQKEQYEKLHDVQNKLSCLLEQEAFAEGFCLAAKIMIEVMDTMGRPSLKD